MVAQTSLGSRPVALTFALSVLALVLTGPADAAGQQGLDSVDALASSGRTEEARGELEIWWDSTRTQSSRRDRQRGLWLRAVLTVDPEMAALDYQRLVVSYPGGPYSDQALVRLAMIVGSGEDLLGAAGYYRSLLQDYPRSPERVGARQWLAQHAEEIAAAEAEAALVAAAAQVVADSIAAEAPPEPEEPVSGDSAEQRGTPAEAVGAYAVQLGAFSTQERADGLARTLAAAGFEIRVVRVESSPLVRVRMGRFAERSAASELMTDVVGLGYDAAIVSDVAEEEPIR